VGFDSSTRSSPQRTTAISRTRLDGADQQNTFPLSNH
jgi:hypothetical protein